MQAPPLDEQEAFLADLSELWHKAPHLTFGQLVTQVYSGLNPAFSQFAFVRFPLEGWQKSVDAILETFNESTGA